MSLEEDMEGITSDVFWTLWQNPERVQNGRPRAWLGMLARNKTIDRLRRLHHAIPLEGDTISMNDTAWELLKERERSRVLREAVEQLSE